MHRATIVTQGINRMCKFAGYTLDPMKDITNKEEIAFFVNSFYDDVLQDELLSPFFRHLNFEKHLPKMIHFWSFVLLDDAGYTTDVTKKHLNMPIQKEHFDRWIELFNATIDKHFSGEKADLAKQRASVIRWTVESKMK